MGKVKDVIDDLKEAEECLQKVRDKLRDVQVFLDEREHYKFSSFISTPIQNMDIAQMQISSLTLKMEDFFKDEL